MSKAVEMLKAFNQTQQELVKTKKMEGTMKLKAWLEQLKNVALMDKFGDKRRKLLTNWRIAFIVVGFISLFFGFAFPPIFLLAAVCITFIVVFSVKISNLSKIDLGNGLRLFVVPLMVVLKEEASDEEKMTMKLDFSNPLTQPYLVKNIPNTSSGYPKITINYYKINWMSGEITLSDGTNISWQLEDFICEKKAVKRNARGKIKNKTKYKIKQDVSMKFNVLKSRYQYVGTPDSNYKDAGEYHQLKVKGRAIATELDTSMDLSYFLGVIGNNYNKFKQL